MVSSDLPEEILIDIFSRLPAKSAGQSRCVSKPWRDILSSPHFIKSHANRKTHQENLMLISRPDCSIHTIFTINDDAVSRKRELLGDRHKIMGCCNGLVLLKNDDECETLLMNPVTLEEVKIPDSPLALPKGVSRSVHGLGYDSAIDDYKIVKLSYYYDTDHEYMPRFDETFVDVYYVKRGVWKRLECSPYDHRVPVCHSGALVNGALHWLAFSRESTNYQFLIAAFNLVDEVFTELPVPVGARVELLVCSKLSVLGGSLCMFDARIVVIDTGNNDPIDIACSRRYAPIDIWIMKEYGLAESWTKFVINVPFKWVMSRHLCFIGDEEVALMIEPFGDRLVICNPRERTWRDMIVDGVPTRFTDGTTFMGSLVSPHIT